MKWIKEKRKNKSIYNMTKLELIANLKEKQKIIDETIEYLKEDIDYWQDAIYVELKAEDFIKILNNYLEILGDKE